MAVPNTFASATTSIPLANLDANFAYYDAAYSISGTTVTYNGIVNITGLTASKVLFTDASKNLTSTGTVAAIQGGTGQASYAIGDLLYASTTTALSRLAAGTATQALVSNGTAAPGWATLTLQNLPGAWTKKAADCATTAALTLNTAQTVIDGVTLTASSRVLVKDQTSALQNGIYTGVTTVTWVRATDADTAGELAGAVVNVDAGTVNGGLLFDTDFKSTDTLGTTAMNWYRLIDTNYTIPATQGGTGVANNAASTITISGNFASTFTVSGAFNYTFPGATSTLASLTGAETFTNKTLTNPTITNYTETLQAVGTVGAASTLALTNGTVLTATLTASTPCTFTMPTASAGKSFVLILTQAATGMTTATFTGVKWAGGTVPVVSATASAVDIVSFVANGTFWYGSISKAFA